MAQNDISEYIKNTRKAGFKDAEIRGELAKGGWSESEIEAAFIDASITRADAAPLMPEIKKSKPVQLKTAVRVPELDAERELPEPHAVVKKTVKKPVIYSPPLAQKTPQARPVQIRSRPLPPKPAIQRRPAMQPKPAKPAMPAKHTMPADSVKQIPAQPAHARSKVFAVVIGLLAVALVASGASGGYWYYAKVVPKKILARALDSFANMKSYSYDAEFTLSARGKSTELSKSMQPYLPQVAGLFFNAFMPREIGVYQNGGADEKNLLFSFTVHANGSVDESDKKNPIMHNIISFSAPAPFSGNVVVESRSMGGISYFRLKELPSFDRKFYAVYGLPPIDINSFENKWVRFDPVTFEDAFNKYIDDLGARDEYFDSYGFYPYGAKGSFGEIFSEEDINKIEELWKNSNFIKWDDAAYKERLAGKPVFRYKGTVIKSEIENYMMEIFKIAGRQPTASEKENMRGAFDAFGDLEFNVWVDRESELVSKVSGFTTVTDPSGQDSSGVVEIVFSLGLSNINKPVSVDVPVEYTDFQDVLSSAGSFVINNLNSARMKARDARRVADIKQLQLALELYAEDNGVYPKSLDKLEPEYIVVVPVDPVTNEQYLYKYIGPSKYKLSALLEDSENQSLLSDANPGDDYFDVTE